MLAEQELRMRATRNLPPVVLHPRENSIGGDETLEHWNDETLRIKRRLAIFDG